MVFQFRLFLFISISIFVLTQCDKTDPADFAPSETNIKLSTPVSLSDPFYFGENVLFNLDLETKDDIGVARLEIIKNGSQPIFSSGNFDASQEKFSIEYKTIEEDIDQFVELSFELTDNDGYKSTEIIGFNVIEEFSFLMENFEIKPAWDLINNLPVNDTLSFNADISIITETVSCGTNCTRYKHTLSSHNGTGFYSFPNNFELSPDNRALRQSFILNAIQHTSKQTKMVVFSSFDEDLNNNQQSLYLLPIIIQIRNKPVFVTFELIEQFGNWRYRKRSEFEGL